MAPRDRRRYPADNKSSLKGSGVRPCAPLHRVSAKELAPRDRRRYPADNKSPIKGSGVRPCAPLHRVSAKELAPRDRRRYPNLTHRGGVGRLGPVLDA